MFDWGNYLTVATHLASNNVEEYQRSAISRAYYSVYCKSRNYLLNKTNYTHNGPSVHKSVWDFCKNSSDRDLRTIGVKGARLKKKRCNADYDDIYGQLTNDVTIALSDANAIKTILDNK